MIKDKITVLWAVLLSHEGFKVFWDSLQIYFEKLWQRSCRHQKNGDRDYE